MHTEQDWIRAICEQPDDISLRLIYADWLDEQELHPLQAKCIRAGMMLMGTEAGNDQMMQLLGGFNWHRHGIYKWEGQSGFISRIEMPCSAFMLHAESIFRAQPITEVVLTDKEADNNLYYGTHQEASYDWHGWYFGDGEFERLLDTAHEVGINIEDMTERFDEIPLADLPEELWYYLKDCGLSEGDAKVYKGVMQALTGLSRACVELGRKRAGLPSL